MVHDSTGALPSWATWALYEDFATISDQPAVAGVKAPGCHQSVFGDWRGVKRARDYTRSTIRWRRQPL